MGRLVEVGLLSVGVEAQLGPPVAAVRVAVPSLPVPGLQDLGRHPGTQTQSQDALIHDFKDSSSKKTSRTIRIH